MGDLFSVYDANLVAVMELGGIYGLQISPHDINKKLGLPKSSSLLSEKLC